MHIDFFWVYDLPSWLVGFLIVAFFILFGIGGLFPTRNLVRRLHRVEHSHNDIVGFYLAAITVMYGITLGLVAVGTWTTHAEVETRVSQEAEILGSLYRDVQTYNDPVRSVLSQDLRDYTRNVIEVSWPAQQHGVVLNTSNAFLNRFQQHFMAFEPTTPRQQIIHAEVYKQFNQLIEIRRARLNTVQSGLPASLWIVVILGAIVTIATTWFFDTVSTSMHLWMTVVLSGLLGLMIYVVASLDNPFRGHEGIKPEPLQLVYNQTMQGQE